MHWLGVIGVLSGRRDTQVLCAAAVAPQRPERAFGASARAI
jgi:hypothetical protein